MAQSPENWNLELAAHLARRAGFGATPEELTALVRVGREKAIDSFLDFGSRNEELEREIFEVGGTLSESFEGERSGTAEVSEIIRSNWIYRMVRERHPLREKLTLLWHDHFACQRSKILRAPQYWGQIETLRLHAAGSFRDLLIAVAKDGGMLAYLDNRLSDAKNPNENWARELLELFTLGVDRDYEQRDVYELARIFTGWTSSDLNSAEFIYDPSKHDSKDKLLFGERIVGRSGEAGMQEGIEAIDRILAKPECTQLIASKLVAWFANHEPAPEQVRKIAQVLRDTGYSIRAALRALFGSDEFFAAENRSNRFKNPVEFVVSAARLLEIQNSHLADLQRHTRALGMDLFEPPSVAGWDHGSAWVHSGAAIARTHFALQLSTLPTSRLRITGAAAFDLMALAGDAESDTDLVQNLATRLLQRGLPERDSIERYLAQMRTSRDPRGQVQRIEKARAALHLLLTSPRFALA